MPVEDDRLRTTNGTPAPGAFEGTRALHLMRTAALCLTGLACIFAAGKIDATNDTQRLSEKERAALLKKMRDKRAGIRLYEGAPPVIPHSLEDIAVGDCLDCHEAGSGPEDDKLPLATPHPNRGACFQCHVPRMAKDVFVENPFRGLKPGPGPTRSNPIGPPYIPHRLHERGECAVCHLDENTDPSIRPVHGSRTNCTQCHVRLQRSAPPPELAEAAD